MTIPLALTGMGMVSSLGSTIGAAAAFRAGISRARAMECFPLDGPDDDGPAYVVGHPARPVAEGFDQMAAWLRLARLAFDDLRTSWDATLWQRLWRDVALVVTLPVITTARYGWSLDDPTQTIDRFFTRKLLALLGRHLPDDRCLVIAEGHTAVAAGMDAARERLAYGRWQRVLLLAVDTLLDRSSITWLLDSQRLKRPGHPHGVMPGEAAVVLLLEHPGERLGQPVGVTVEDVAVERSPTDVAKDSVQREPAVARARRWRSAFSRLSPALDLASSVDQYVDLTGEIGRAEVWGHLQPHLHQRITAGRTWFPAEGFGETGAASSAVACVLAARSWARSYAGGDRALIWSLADHGHAGVIRLCRST